MAIWSCVKCQKEFDCDYRGIPQNYLCDHCQIIADGWLYFELEPDFFGPGEARVYSTITIAGRWYLKWGVHLTKYMGVQPKLFRLKITSEEITTDSLVYKLLIEATKNTVENA